MTPAEARRRAARLEREADGSKMEHTIADACDIVRTLADQLDQLLAALPRCSECSRPATAAMDGRLTIGGERPAGGVCDEHADRDPPRRYAADRDLPWAAAVRAAEGGDTF